MPHLELRARDIPVPTGACLVFRWSHGTVSYQQSRECFQWYCSVITHAAGMIMKMQRESEVRHTVIPGGSNMWLYKQAVR